MSNSVFGVSERALQLCEDRSVLLTNNLVNASTPHYKARDIDFHQALQNVNQAPTLAVTNPGHIAATGELSGENLLYRLPMQTSFDCNTVDPDIERKNFIENAMRYQVNLTFIQNKSDEIRKAIKGE